MWTGFEGKKDFCDDCRDRRANDDGATAKAERRESVQFPQHQRQRIAEHEHDDEDTGTPNIASMPEASHDLFS